MDDKKKIVIHSKVTNKLYEDNESVHIWNPIQAYKFMTSGAELLDIFPGHDKNGGDRLCFVFTRKDFDILQPLWTAHKL